MLLNDGDGYFSVKTEYETGGRSWTVYSADFDGDGFLDFAVPESDSDSLCVFMNNTDGTFTTAVKYATGDSPQGLYAIDFDGDSTNIIFSTIDF